MSNISNNPEIKQRFKHVLGAVTPSTSPFSEHKQVKREAEGDPIPSPDGGSLTLDTSSPLAPADMELEQQAIDKSTAAYGAFMFTLERTKNNTFYISKPGLYYAGILKALELDGFMQRRTLAKQGEEHNAELQLIRIHNSIIEPVSASYALEHFKAQHIDTLPDSIIIRINDVHREFTAEKLKETFLKQAHLVFNATKLQYLQVDTAPILEDEPGVSYFAFQNEIIQATAEGLKRIAYSEAPGRVWRSRIIRHRYEAARNENASPGHWQRFIENVSNAANEPGRYAAFRSAIGYLLHGYSSPENSQAVICYDEEMNGNSPEGRTGKGLFLQGIAQLRNAVNIDGKALDTSNRFAWQQVNEATQIITIDETGKKFSFDALFSMLTSGMTIERKGKDSVHISTERAPKLCITSNTALSHAGRSTRDRQFIIEFSPHYSKRISTGTQKPVKAEHGRVFFGTGWTYEDQGAFIRFQLECVTEYHRDGLQHHRPKNAFKKELAESTGEAFAKWASEQKIEALRHRPLSELLAEYEDATGEAIEARTFGNYLSTFAALFGYSKNVSRKRDQDGKKYSVVNFTPGL
jgi:hypothetical protein